MAEIPTGYLSAMAEELDRFVQEQKDGLAEGNPASVEAVALAFMDSINATSFKITPEDQVRVLSVLLATAIQRLAQ